MRNARPNHPIWAVQADNSNTSKKPSHSESEIFKDKISNAEFGFINSLRFVYHWFIGLLHAQAFLLFPDSIHESMFLQWLAPA